MSQERNRIYIFSQEESLQVLIIKPETTENIHTVAIRNALLEFENFRLRQQQAQSQTQIAELESQVQTLEDVCTDLSSQIPYADSPHCEVCGRSS